MREFILFTFNLWIHNEVTCAVFIVHFYGIKSKVSGYTTTQALQFPSVCSTNIAAEAWRENICKILDI
jgi:hypothetical protein